MKYRAILLLFSILFATGSMLHAARPLTLEECLSIAEQESEKIAAGQKGGEAASHRKNAALFRFFPTGSLDINIMKYVFIPEPETFDLSGLGIPADAIDMPSMEAPEKKREITVTAAQPVTPLWSIYNGYDAARTEERIAELDTERQKSEVKKTVIGHFYRYQLSAALRDLLVDVRAQLQSYREQAEHLVSAGMTDRRAVLKLDVELSKIEREMNSVNGAMSLIQNNLAVILNKTPDAFDIARTEVSFSPIDSSQTELLSLQKTHRSEFKMLDASLEIRNNMEHIAFQPLIPSVAVTTGFMKTWDPQPFASEGTFFVGGALQWDVGFDWITHIATYREARAETVKTRLENIDKKEKMRLQILNMYNNLTVTGKEIALARAEIRAAEETLRIEENKYRENMTTETDLIAAQVAVKKARTSLLRAVYTYEIRFRSLVLTLGIEPGTVRRETP